MSQLNRLVVSRWFALADLACASVAALWGYAQPAAGGWVLLVALVPWLLRLASGRFPFQRTIFDLLVAIFLLTAFVGVWAAYDRQTAWSKLWIILVAILLY